MLTTRESKISGARFWCVLPILLNHSTPEIKTITSHLNTRMKCAPSDFLILDYYTFRILFNIYTPLHERATHNMFEHQSPLFN
jgi:hypothetical protein